MIGGIIVELLALVVVLAVAWPLVRRDGGADPVADDPRRRNLSEEDFVELDRAERAKAARLLRRRDALDAGENPPA